MPLLPLPALDTLDDGLQLPVAEGLEQIVHRPQLHRRLGIGEVAVGGEEDHIGPVALGPELPYHLQPIQPGHLDVGNDEVGAVACDDLQSLLAVGGLPTTAQPTEAQSTARTIPLRTSSSSSTTTTFSMRGPPFS